MINFISGLVLGMILILVGEWVRLARKKTDDRSARIAKVVDTYIAVGNREKELIAFIRAGATQLKDHLEILEADGQILSRRPPAPVPALVKQLVPHEDLLVFLKWCVERKTPPLALGDLINDRTTRELVESFLKER